MKKDILELENRRKILNFINDYPGLHIRDISRKIDIPYSTLEYHLNYLRKHNFVNVKTERNYKRYYITNKIGVKEKKILNFLRTETPRGIILLLLAYVTCSQTELSENLEKDPSTIYFHLKKLENMDIVERVSIEKNRIEKEDLSLVIRRKKISNESIYMLKNPDFIYDLLILYKDNLFDNISTNFVYSYITYFLSEGLPQKIQSPKSSIDSIFEVITDLFPMPFCA